MLKLKARTPVSLSEIWTLQLFAMAYHREDDASLKQQLLQDSVQGAICSSREFY